MPFWNWIPSYAEEITINQVQETLSEFKQLVPDNFVELGQPKKYWGSTEGLDKPLCERYTFKYDNKSYTLDIDQELSEELKLNLGDDFCVKKEVLSRPPEEEGITINDKEEIFLRKNFAVKNLKVDIDELFKKIKKLEKEKEELKKELEKELSWWDKWLNSDYINKKYIYIFVKTPDRVYNDYTYGFSLDKNDTNCNRWWFYVNEPFSISDREALFPVIKKLYEYYKNQ